MRRIVLALLMIASAAPLFATDPILIGPYQYDGAGNVRAIGSGESFLYDRDSRLVSATMTPGAETFGYDPFGNRTSAQITSGITRCNNGADCLRMPQMKSRTNRIAEASYNAAGAVVTLDSRIYAYDSTGMMTSQTNAQRSLQYVYTADDERIAVYTGGRWEWSLRDPDDHVIRQVTSNDAASAPGSTNWTWSEDNIFRGGAVLASERPAIGRRHFHLDHLGTPRLITADTGAIAAQYEYYAFGPQPDDSGPRETPTEELEYTGHQRDLTAGDVHVLDYMHARYYTGAMGRFLAVDPLADSERAAANPQMWNRYAYVQNNPMTNVDPNGKETRVFFIGATNIVSDSSGAFGHTAVWVSANGHSNGLSFGGQFDFRKDSAYQNFVSSYTNEGRTVDVMVLNTTPEQDKAMLEHIDATKPNLGTWSILGNNCTTTTAETLKAGGVLPSTQAVVWRGGVTRTDVPDDFRPEQLKDTLLSMKNVVKEHYEVKPPTKEETKKLLDRLEQP
jgi:RHS repeat-associated protein